MSKQKIQAPRGTQDILPEISELWQYIENTAIETCAQAGFAEIRTPIFESTDLFKRAVGEDSDIVNKEMYTFLDKSDRSITLRPEGTAAVVRSFVDNALDRGQKPIKLWYRGPMFRYERPQTGRYRQFHQIGLEAFGLKGPYIDVEMIVTALQLLENLGLKRDALKLYINSLGTPESRNKYRVVLKEFLAGLQDQVCEDCQRRYEQNPLRALDCKVPADQALYTNAPSIYDCFDQESIEQWQIIRSTLKALGIEYIEDPKLVRGLDYYSHVVFEFKVERESLGQQSTVLAGGRYDSLVELLGGKETPAVGWALGIERLAIVLKEFEIDKQLTRKKKIFIVSDDISAAQRLAFDLRTQGVAVEYDFDTAKIPKQIDKALKRDCRYVLFYLESERNSGKFKLKDLESKSEQEYDSLEDLSSAI